MIYVFCLMPKAGHQLCSLKYYLCLSGPERPKGSASMNAVDINRLAQLSRQARCGLARDHCLGQLFRIQGEDHRLWLWVILFSLAGHLFFLEERFAEYFNLTDKED